MSTITGCCCCSVCLFLVYSAFFTACELEETSARDCPIFALCNPSTNESKHRFIMATAEASDHDEDTSSIQSRTENPAVVTFKNLEVVAKARKQLLLKGISGQIRGGFWACMGPSGSGKSTLLNTLALRLDPGVKVTGDLRLNGRPCSNAQLKRMSGYVMQDDLFNGNLTCEEQLTYTARLRCPQDTSAAQRKARVDGVLRQVGLEHARHTSVGTPLKKGISGGERKRLAVAQELLVEPQLLFLDEPTTGLDSVTALSLCHTLRKISDACSVICTIHQPQSKIFALFDNLILLKAGDIAYQGPAKQALPFFESTGHPCPPLTNPADHLLDVVSLTRSESSHSLADVDLAAERELHLRFTRPEIDLLHGADRPQLPLRQTTSWLRQFSVLLDSSFKEQTRKTGMIAAQLIQMLIMAILIGFAFFQIGTDQMSVQLRKPVLFFCVINQGLFSALAVINSFPGKRMLALRERAAGTYKTSTYFTAKMLAETALQVILPIIFSCIVYWTVGLQPVASKFFIFTGFMILCSLSATSLALLISAFARTTDLSVTMLPSMLETFRLFGAFYMPPASTPAYFVWLNDISYVTYSYTGVSINENRGLKLTCTSDELEDVNGQLQCPIPDGDVILEADGLNKLSIGECAGILVFYIVFVRFLAYLGVRFLKW
ncbi:P-loop containing nucleoside triphosphate hydrolase protein [Tribonema minus]|uniref:P-loop containing nucleoside triphosphate hydrolase protein n=1 Tax=Tribonema minus TaxID=303371 RepID=A0A835ZBW7_9STRA|nr:P-loop containing nucleoside triphosphate hydrolase protein [Tribonema minus]